MNYHYGHNIYYLNTDGFVPYGAVAVVTSMECVDWLRELVSHLWLFKVGEEEEEEGVAPYRGMPLIILALDPGEE